MRVVATKHFDSSMGKFVNKVSVHSDIRPKLEKREVTLAGSEVLEVINSFRTPFSIPLVRMEQVTFCQHRLPLTLSIHRWIWNRRLTMKGRIEKRCLLWSILNQRTSNVLWSLRRTMKVQKRCL